MIQIGKDKFDVPSPAGMRSFSLQQRILPVAGRVVEVFAHLLQLAPGADITKLFDADVLKVLPAAMPHIGRIFSEMQPGELEAITRELLRDATVSQGKAMLPLFGSPGGDVFDAKMQGRTTDTWKLLWYALEAWYPDFFSVGAQLRTQGAEKANPSKESTTSETSGPATA